MYVRLKRFGIVDIETGAIWQNQLYDTRKEARESVSLFFGYKVDLSQIGDQWEVKQINVQIPKSKK